MALLALFVGKSRIGFLTLQLVIVLAHILCEVNKDVFDPVGCFGIEKLERILRCGQMTIHAISHKALCVVGMGRRFPGIVGELNLVA